jgi:hypothetical protein
MAAAAQTDASGWTFPRQGSSACALEPPETRRASFLTGITTVI